MISFTPPANIISAKIIRTAFGGRNFKANAPTIPPSTTPSPIEMSGKDLI